MRQQILSFALRLGVTAVAFWLIFRTVDLGSLKATLLGAHRGWLSLGFFLYVVAQAGCVVRWRCLVPAYPSIGWRFLTNSFMVGSFFNTLLPTTVGGDVIRSYDLIKATGQWRDPIASVLLDRLVGMGSLLVFGLAAWLLFPPAQKDPVISLSFLGYCLLFVATVFVLRSRRTLQASLKPFKKIGLGILGSHANQFQETLLSYLRHPQALLKSFGISLAAHVAAISMFVILCRALTLPVPTQLVILLIPIVSAVSQLPISLNGWGIREGTLILLLGRVGVEPAQALSLSLMGAAIPIFFGAVGGLFFLSRQRRRRKA